jgi:hypothetical protein
MRGQLLILSHLFPVLLVSMLVLPAPSLWAQETPLLENTSVRLFDYTTQFRRRPDPGTDLHLLFKELPLNVEAKQGRSIFRLRFFAPRTGYYPLLIKNEGAPELQQRTGTAELLGTPRINSGALSGWQAPIFIKVRPPPIFIKVRPSPIHRPHDLGYHSQHVPWAAPIIQRARQQGNAHPHVTEVLKLFTPTF